MKRIIACFAFAVVFILPTNAAKRKVPRTLSGYINGIAVSPNGKYVTCGLKGNVIQLWDTERGVLIRNLPHSLNEIPLVWTQTNNILVTSFDKQEAERNGAHTEGYHICVRQMPSGKKLRTFPNMHGKIWTDGKIIRVTDGIIIRTWRISDGTLIYGHPLELLPRSRYSSQWIPYMTFSRNGEYLSCETDSIDISAVSNNGRYLVMQGENPNWTIPLDPDGDVCQRPSCYNRELTLELWDLHTNKRIRVWRGYWSGNSGATFLQFSNDSKTLFTGNNDAKSRIYDVSSGKEEYVNFQGTQDISQNDTFWAFGYQHIIHIISLKTGKVIGIVPNP